MLTFACCSNRTYREGYLNLLSIEPKISDFVTSHSLAELMSQLDKGRNEFRNSQVHTICDRISGWGTGVPGDKQLRGFGSDVCGRLLCPPTHDWENPMYVPKYCLVPRDVAELMLVSRRTREQIRSFQIHITADDFPRFLWEDERVDLQDMKKGFLRGELLTKVYTLLLSEPETFADALLNTCRYSSLS